MDNYPENIADTGCGAPPPWGRDDAAGAGTIEAYTVEDGWCERCLEVEPDCKPNRAVAAHLCSDCVDAVKGERDGLRMAVRAVENERDNAILRLNERTTQLEQSLAQSERAVAAAEEALSVAQKLRVEVDGLKARGAA